MLLARGFLSSFWVHLRHVHSGGSYPAQVLLKIKNHLVVCSGANMVALRLPTVIGQLGTPQKAQRISKANSNADITLKSYSLCPRGPHADIASGYSIRRYPHLQRVSAVCVCMCAWNKWKVHKLNLLTEAQKDLLEMHGTGSWYKMAGLKSSRLRTSQNLLAWHDRQEKEAPQSLRQLAAGCFRMCLHLLRSACLHSLHHCGLFISSHYRFFSLFGLIGPLASISIH